jgi:hypothetical protein
MASLCLQPCQAALTTPARLLLLQAYQAGAPTYTYTATGYPSSDVR